MRDRRPLSLLIFSDARVQDLSVLVGYVRSLATRPDLILYAGDDLDRFHLAPNINYFAQLAVCAAHGLVAVAGNDDRPRAAARLMWVVASVMCMQNRCCCVTSRSWD